jgi:transcriptional regulator with XRE-family HTH domain
MPIDGEKVEHYRVSQGKMRKDLARESGVSYSQIAQIERGETGGSEHSAKAIADALGITIDDIWLYPKDERKRPRSRHTRW